MRSRYSVPSQAGLAMSVLQAASLSRHSSSLSVVLQTEWLLLVMDRGDRCEPFFGCCRDDGDCCGDED